MKDLMLRRRMCSLRAARRSRRRPHSTHTLHSRLHGPAPLQKLRARHVSGAQGRQSLVKGGNKIRDGRSPAITTTIRSSLFHAQDPESLTERLNLLLASRNAIVVSDARVDAARLELVVVGERSVELPLGRKAVLV